MNNKIDNFFGISKLSSNIKTEVLAGVSTFLALSYIFVVNPAILSEAGVDKSAVFFATIVGSVITTLAMALWANKPFAVAPGLEMNAYVAFVVVGVLGFSWQEAMGAVFWSGVFTVLFSLTKIRVKILEAIPDKLKTGLAASVGMFLVLIALKISGLLAFSGIQVQGVGKINSVEALVFLVGLVLVFMFKHFKVRGSILLSIIGASVIAHFLGIGQNIETVRFSKEMLSAFWALDLKIIFNLKIWSVIIILFILDFYGSIAKFIGLTRNTSIMDEKGNLPKLKEALIVDGAGTVLGAGLGTSNLITYVESAVGIGEGGRTGLTALICALSMALFLPLLPLVNLVPVVATTGALFLVGVMLIPFKEMKEHFSWADRVPVLVMIVTTVWTFGLDKAMFSGFASFVLLFAISGKWKQINIYLLGSTLLLLVSIILSK